MASFIQSVPYRRLFLWRPLFRVSHIGLWRPLFRVSHIGTPLNRPPLGPVKVSLLEGWPHFRGEFVLKSMLWDFSKWPEYRGYHISGVLIRGVPLYFYSVLHSECPISEVISSVLYSECPSESYMRGPLYIIHTCACACMDDKYEGGYGKYHFERRLHPLSLHDAYHTRIFEYDCYHNHTQTLLH